MCVSNNCLFYVHRITVILRFPNHSQKDTPTEAQTICMYCFSCFTASEYTIPLISYHVKDTKRDHDTIFPWRKQNWPSILIVPVLVSPSDVCRNSRKNISNIFNISCKRLLINNKARGLIITLRARTAF